VAAVVEDAHTVFRRCPGSSLIWPDACNACDAVAVHQQEYYCGAGFTLLATQRISPAIQMAGEGSFSPLHYDSNNG
jgi:hypothetical protein